MKKKIVITCTVAALLVIGIIGGTLAYMTDSDSKDNTFTVGNVKIDLTEESWQQPDTVVPGHAYTKDPTVKNTGINSAYIRVNVTASDYAAFAAAMTKHNISDLSGIFSGYDSTRWKRLTDPVIDTKADTITYTYYYIYEGGIVPAGGTTDPLFTSVTIPAAFTSEDMKSLGEEFTINITADAIQAEGFSDINEAFAAFDGTL